MLKTRDLSGNTNNRQPLINCLSIISFFSILFKFPWEVTLNSNNHLVKVEAVAFWTVFSSTKIHWNARLLGLCPSSSWESIPNFVCREWTPSIIDDVPSIITCGAWPNVHYADSWVSKVVYWVLMLPILLPVYHAQRPPCNTAFCPFNASRRSFDIILSSYSIRNSSQLIKFT